MEQRIVSPVADSQTGIRRDKSEERATDFPPRSLSKPMSRQDTETAPAEVDERSRMIIRAIREQIPELQPSSPFFIRFDDQYLHRFVKARKYNMGDILVMVKNHVEWFKSFRVPEIQDFEFTELEQFRTVYPHGYHGVDKLGRPLYIERYSKMNAGQLYQISNLERVSRYWVQGYERLLFQRFPASIRDGKPALQTCVILDLQGVKLSMFDSKAREFLRTVSKISSDNYPETLGVMLIVNVPSFFSVVYSVAKPLIPAETKKKIHIITARHVKEELLKYIDEDQLPQFLGGSCVCDPKSTADDKGCLSSDKGPWKTFDGDGIDDFVSCHDREGFDSRSFDSVIDQLENLPDARPTSHIQLPGGHVREGTYVRRTKSKGWFKFNCFRGKSSC